MPAALVNIPTGGGKTAVIGAVAHWHPKLNRVLVLAPRLSIRNQLSQELAARRGFFAARGYVPSSLPKRVIRIDSKDDIPSPLPDDTIFVATIQLLNKLSAQPDRSPYDRLSAGCDAVIVDEGHYEPALSWSLAIRGLLRPTILVTATPYRNDLKAFKLDDSAIYISKYKELARAHILRVVDVVRVDPANTISPADFVNSVLGAFAAKYGEAPSSTRKLIIRCRTRGQIRQIGDLIRRNPLGAGGVLCLHEKFKATRNRPWEKRHPSDPELEGAPAIWVHQHKLLEGVDGPSFRALAFYGVVGSSRALVQQVGRVVRNPTRDETESALMIDHSGGLLEGMWNRYLEYDAQVTATSLRLGIREIADAFEREQPPIIYAERQFRQSLAFNAPAEVEVRRSLRLPPRCHLYNLRSGATLEQLSNSTVSRLEEAEFPTAVMTSNEDEVVILFAKLQTSPLLADHYFIERELHAFVARRMGNIVAVLDSSRSGLCLGAIALIGKPVSRASLGRLLNGSDELRLVEVSARNAALGLSAVRRRSATAVSLEGAPLALDEFQYVASTVKAVDRRSRSAIVVGPEFSSRSIGFAKGRVSDSDVRVELSQWLAWTSQLITASADLGRKIPQYLDRFAQPLESPPRYPWPKTVLMDFEDAREQFVSIEADGSEATLDVDDACVDLAVDTRNRAAPRAISIVANGRVCPGSIEYDSLGSRYILVSDALEKRYRHVDGIRPGNLVEFLNANQSFLVLPDSPNVIYAEGAFYNPRLPTGAKFDPDALGLSDLIVHQAALRTCTSEKGGEGTAVAQTWAVGSVFRWLDDNADTLLPNAELILCDDGTRESCDFLLVGTRGGRPVVVMVHAKASATPSFVAASKLHEICSQAVKQVGTLALFGPQRPEQFRKWRGPWVGPSREGTVASRIRRATGSWAGLTGPQIWDGISELLKRQETDREVAVVLGASLDKQRLFAQLSQARTPGPAVHALHLVRATMASIAGGGARLKIYCG